MAIWQVDFELSPRNNVALSSDSIKSDSIKKLQLFFSLGKSWHDNLTVYGDLDSTCIKIWKTENEPIEVSCRIDVKAVRKQELQAIIDFSQENDLVLIHDDEIVEPTFDNVKRILINSPAYRFSKNPYSFFESLSKGN